MSNIPDDVSSTATRTLHIAEALLQHPEGLGANSLLQAAGGGRSSLFTLLQSLRASGYIEQAEPRGLYRPGPRLQAWLRASPPPAADLTLAFYQEAARQPLAETLVLVIPSEAGALVLAQVESLRQVRCAFAVGQSTSSPAAVEALKAEPGPACRSNGYAFTAGDPALDLALPICRDGSRPVAALLLSAPRFRWETHEFLHEHLARLRGMATRLSYRLGAPYYTPYHAEGESEPTPTEPLGAAEIEQFLQGPWAARLACIRPDGRPHVIPVWQEWDGRFFYVIAWQGSQWAEYVLQNPNISLTIDEPWLPLRRVAVRGQAEALPGEFNLQPLLERLATRYLGQPSPPGRVVRAFRIQPEALRGWQGL